MATKSEESLRAFVEEEEAPAQPAPAPSPAPAVLPALIPPVPGSTGAKKSGASGKTAKTTPAPKKAAGGATAGANGAKTAQAATGNLQQNLTDAGNTLVARIASWDTPGGIGLLLLALFILLWMIVPVNGGHTRFGLLWLTLTGQTTLPDDSTSPAASSGNGGLGGLGGCPPGYIPDGKGGCVPAGAPFPGFPGLGLSQPIVGSAWPDLSGPNGFNPGQLIGV